MIVINEEVCLAYLKYVNSIGKKCVIVDCKRTEDLVRVVSDAFPDMAAWACNKHKNYKEGIAPCNTYQFKILHYNFGDGMVI